MFCGKTVSFIIHFIALVLNVINLQQTVWASDSDGTSIYLFSVCDYNWRSGSETARCSSLISTCNLDGNYTFGGVVITHLPKCTEFQVAQTFAIIAVILGSCHVLLGIAQLKWPDIIKELHFQVIGTIASTCNVIAFSAFNTFINAATVVKGSGFIISVVSFVFHTVGVVIHCLGSSGLDTKLWNRC